LDAALELPCSGSTQIPILFVRLFIEANAFLCFKAFGISDNFIRLEAVENHFFANGQF